MLQDNHLNLMNETEPQNLNCKTTETAVMPNTIQNK